MLKKMQYKIIEIVVLAMCYVALGVVICRDIKDEIKKRNESKD